MKNSKIKYLLTIIWVCCSTQIFCQSLAEAQRYFDEGRLDQAKQQIDEYIITNSSDVKGLVLKSKIYYTLGSEKRFSDVVADGKAIAISALKNANELNNQTTYNLLQQESFGLPINIYNSLSSDGIIYYNSAVEKNDKALFEQALSKFKKAISFSTFINDNNWALQPLDSNNLFYAAKAAIYANKNDEGLLYAKKIADNNITTTFENKGFQPIYEWLTYYYRTNNNGELLYKYANLGSRFYPKSPFFILSTIDWLRETKQYTELFNQYNLLFSKGFSTPSYQSAYFNDLYNSITAESWAANEKKIYNDLFIKEATSYINKNKNAFFEMLLLAKYHNYLAAEGQKNKEPQKIVTSNKTKAKFYLKKIIDNKLSQKNKPLLDEAKAILKTL